MDGRQSGMEPGAEHIPPRLAGLLAVNARVTRMNREALQAATDAAEAQMAFVDGLRTGKVLEDMMKQSLGN